MNKDNKKLTELYQVVQEEFEPDDSFRDNSVENTEKMIQKAYQAHLAFDGDDVKWLRYVITSGEYDLSHQVEILLRWKMYA